MRDVVHYTKCKHTHYTLYTTLPNNIHYTPLSLTPYTTHYTPCSPSPAGSSISIASQYIRGRDGTMGCLSFRLIATCKYSTARTERCKWSTARTKDSKYRKARTVLYGTSRDYSCISVERINHSKLRLRVNIWWMNVKNENL